VWACVWCVSGLCLFSDLRLGPTSVTGLFLAHWHVDLTSSNHGVCDWHWFEFDVVNVKCRCLALAHNIMQVQVSRCIAPPWPSSPRLCLMAGFSFELWLTSGRIDGNAQFSTGQAVDFNHVTASPPATVAVHTHVGGQRQQLQVTMADGTSLGAKGKGKGNVLAGEPGALCVWLTSPGDDSAPSGGGHHHGVTDDSPEERAASAAGAAAEGAAATRASDSAAEDGRAAGSDESEG